MPPLGGPGVSTVAGGQLKCDEKALGIAVREERENFIKC
jgi:hypothetical protein